jgi:hypothetical protein
MESSKFYCPRSEAVPRSALRVASFFHQSSSTHSCWTISESGYDILAVPTLYTSLYTNLVKFLREVFLPCTMAKLLNYQLKGSCFQKLIHENYNRGICDYNYISTKIWVLTCYAFLNLTSYNRDIFNYMANKLNSS